MMKYGHDISKIQSDLITVSHANHLYDKNVNRHNVQWPLCEKNHSLKTMVTPSILSKTWCGSRDMLKHTIAFLCGTLRYLKSNRYEFWRMLSYMNHWLIHKRDLETIWTRDIFSWLVKSAVMSSCGWNKDVLTGADTSWLSDLVS